MTKYRMYVDEVGNPDLESSDNPNHRFLNLTGVIIKLEYVRLVINPQMESLKHKKGPFGPMAFAIHLRKTGLNSLFLTDSKCKEKLIRLPGL